MVAKREKYSDEEILAGLRGGREKSREVLKFLYREHFAMIRKMIVTNSGNPEDAHDIFQEVLVIFYEKVRNDKLRLSALVSTYLYSIGRNLWIDQLRKRKVDLKFRDSLPQQQDLETPVKRLLEKEKLGLLKKLMTQLKKDCYKILTLSIYEERPMKEISFALGYKNEQIARNKKHRCLKYLKSLIADSALYSSAFE